MHPPHTYTSKTKTKTQINTVYSYYSKISATNNVPILCRLCTVNTPKYNHNIHIFLHKNRKPKCMNLGKNWASSATSIEGETTDCGVRVRRPYKRKGVKGKRCDAGLENVSECRCPRKAYVHRTSTRNLSLPHRGKKQHKSRHQQRKNAKTNTVTETHNRLLCLRWDRIKFPINVQFQWMQCATCTT